MVPRWLGFALPAAARPLWNPQSSRRRARPRRAQREAGVTEVLGSVLLVGIAVGAAVAFSLLVASIPAPSGTPHALLEAFLLPTNPERLIVEHRGGLAAPLRQVTVVVSLDAAETHANLGERLAAGDPAWAVVGSDGTAKSASGSFEPGDQVRYTSASIRGKRVEVAVLYEGLGALVLGPAQVQASDTTAPAMSSARTTSTTTLRVNFSEPLDTIAASDFTLSGGLTISSVQLIGNSSVAEFTTSAMAPDATPTVSRIASPTGTKDLAGLLLAGTASVVAADGTAPSINSGPSASVTTSSATITWGTNEASDSVVEFGPTPSLGRSASDTAAVTSHSLTLGGLSPGTFYYYRASSADAAGNRVTSALLDFTTTAVTAGSNPTFGGPVVNIIYVSTQQKNAAGKIGLNIINPTSAAREVDLVRFTASPTLGTPADSKFFRGTLTTGAGSDAEFSCTWSGAGSDAVTCDPAGTFTLPARGMKQVVLQFTTSNEGADAHTIITGEAVITSPTSETVTTAHNVRHQPSGLHFDLLALSGAGGSQRAGHAPAASGSPVDFHYKWTAVSGDAKLRTRFIIPAGWSTLLVPSQSSLADLALNVRQPTPTSQGYVDVSHDLTAGSREFFFRVTPPSGAEALVMQVDFEGSKEGSGKLSFSNLLWFGVSLT